MMSLLLTNDGILRRMGCNGSSQHAWVDTVVFSKVLHIRQGKIGRQVQREACHIHSMTVLLTAVTGGGTGRLVVKGNASAAMHVAKNIGR